jgi:hypothetical protein
MVQAVRVELPGLLVERILAKVALAEKEALPVREALVLLLLEKVVKLEYL